MVIMASAVNYIKKEKCAGDLRVMAFGLFSQGFSIMMAQFRSFFRREIGFLRCVKMFFHLFYDMFCFKVMLNFQVGRRFGQPHGRARRWGRASISGNDPRT